MNARGGHAQLLTARLLAHAEKIMPASRAGWLKAMAGETAHIASGRAALWWAFGCVTASYGERMRADHYYLPLLARLYLACVCIAYAMGHFVEAPYPQMLCRLLGTPQPFYPPFPFAVPFASYFVPHYSAGSSCYFMQAAPFWPSVLRLAESALFLFAALQLIRKRLSALTAFALAFLIAWGLPLVWRIASRSVVHFSPPHDQMRELLLNTLFGVLYPLIIGTCMALLVREDGVRKESN